MKAMERCVRLVLALLLCALAVGTAYGELLLDKSGNWRYEEVDPGKTCRIEPADKSKIAGAVIIPEQLMLANGGGELLVAEIREDAFYQCAGITSITIPTSVNVIGKNNFRSCYKLTEINVQPGNTSFESVGGVLFNRKKTTLIRYPEGKSGAYTIPSSVLEIGVEAFVDCGGLTAVTVPSSVKTIKSFAFGLCVGLQTVSLSSGVTTIESGAFAKCTGLTEMPIPSSVTIIGRAAFGECSRLEKFKVDSRNHTFSSVDGVLFSYGKETIVCYPGGKQGQYTIPGSVKAIEKYAFVFCAGLIGVDIPGSVKSIGEGAFGSCSNLVLIRWHGDQSVKVDGNVFEEEVRKEKFLCVKKGQADNFKKLAWVKENKLKVSDAQTVVVLDANGGSFPDGSSRKVVELQKTPATLGESEAAAPNRKGCNFQGYIKEVGSTEKFDFSKEIAEDLVLVARWDRYAVQFTVFGGIGNQLEGAEVKVGGLSGKTDAKGEASVLLSNGEYQYTVSLANYEMASGRLIVQDRNLESKYVTLYKSSQGGATPPSPAPVEYALTITSGAHGSVRVTRNDARGEALTGGAKLKEGDQLLIAATPAEGYALESLTVNGQDHASGSVFTVGRANVAVAATFKAEEGHTPTPPTAVESVLLAAARVVQSPIGSALVLEGIGTAERVEVYSLAGMRIYARDLHREDRVAIDVAGWASGIYVARLIAADGEKAMRVVKR